VNEVQGGMMAKERVEELGLAGNTRNIQIKYKQISMDKEDVVIALQSHFGLTSEHLTIDFREQENEIRIIYDLNGYDLDRPLNLDAFWEKLQNLPSTQSQEIDAQSRQAMVSRQELEDLLSRLGPPIQA
jgi:hypothetical protein